jgi:hypothetical protein
MNMKKAKTPTTLTRLFGTIAIGGGVLAASLMSSAAQAACEQTSGKTISGIYIPAHTLDESKSDRSSVFITLKQTGCELQIKNSVVEQYLNYTPAGKFLSKTKVTNGGVWKFDLSGAKKAVIPQQYITANSNDPRSIAMTKSLEVYTKLKDDGKVHFTVLFDFEHAGAIVKMSAEADVEFSEGQTSYGFSPQKFSGSMNLVYPGFKFQIVPSAQLAEKTGARNLIIANGANWLLEALQPQINDALQATNFFFMRK